MHDRKFFHLAVCNLSAGCSRQLALSRKKRMIFLPRKALFTLASFYQAHYTVTRIIRARKATTNFERKAERQSKFSLEF